MTELTFSEGLGIEEFYNETKVSGNFLSLDSENVLHGISRSTSVKSGFS